MALELPAPHLAVPALPAIDDDGLAALAARGSQRAFIELYQRHSAALYRYCHAILRHPEDAQDAVQATMARALAVLERREPPDAWQPWLFSIARNESIDQLRRRRNHGPLRDAETIAGAPFEGRVEQRERLADLLVDLDRLPKRQRSALVLRELRGMSDQEIAEALAISSAGVRQAVFEARSALRDFSAGRDLSCTTVRELIASGDGRRLRARQVRAHLRACPECHAAVAQRRAEGRGVWSLPVPSWLHELLARASVGPAGADAIAGAGLVSPALLAAVAATALGPAPVRPDVRAAEANARPAHVAPAPPARASARPAPVIRQAAAAAPAARAPRPAGTPAPAARRPAPAPAAASAPPAAATPAPPAAEPAPQPASAAPAPAPTAATPSAPPAARPAPAAETAPGPPDHAAPQAADPAPGPPDHAAPQAADPSPGPPPGAGAPADRGQPGAQGAQNTPPPQASGAQGQPNGGNSGDNGARRP